MYLTSVHQLQSQHLAFLASLVAVFRSHADFHVDIGAAKTGLVACKMIAAIDKLVSPVDFPVLALAMNTEFDIADKDQRLLADTAVLNVVGLGLAAVEAGSVRIPAPARTLAGNLGRAFGTFQGISLEHPGTGWALPETLGNAESTEVAAIFVTWITKGWDESNRLVGSLAHAASSGIIAEFSHPNTTFDLLAPRNINVIVSPLICRILNIFVGRLVLNLNRSSVERVSYSDCELYFDFPHPNTT